MRFTGSNPFLHSQSLSLFGPKSFRRALLDFFSADVLAFFPAFFIALSNAGAKLNKVLKPTLVANPINAPPQSGTYGPPNKTGLPAGIGRGRENAVGAKSVGVNLNFFLAILPEPDKGNPTSLQVIVI